MPPDPASPLQPQSKQTAAHPIYATMDAAIIAEYQRVCADRDKYLSWHQRAESDAERLQMAVEEAHRILTVEDAMYEDTDSPGNMAWAVLTAALEAIRRV